MISAVAVTVTVTAAAIAIYTDARCICNRVVMSVPGKPLLEVRRVRTPNHRSGNGRVVKCKRCRTLVEVIEHG